MENNIALNRKQEMRNLRDSGWTYQRIADHLGVSKQYVWQEIRRRLREPYYEKIPYKGLYKLFQDDKSLTVPKFCVTVFHHHGHDFITRMTNFIGGGDSRVSVSQIKKILDYCGGTFEEVFSIREDGSKE